MALAIVACVGDVANNVKHRAACASQDGHERDELPQPAVLHDGPDVWPERHERSSDASNRCEGEEYGEPVRWPVDFGDGPSWQVPSDPIPDRFRGRGTDVYCKHGDVYIM